MGTWLPEGFLHHQLTIYLVYAIYITILLFMGKHGSAQKKCEFLCFSSVSTQSFKNYSYDDDDDDGVYDEGVLTHTCYNVCV